MKRLALIAVLAMVPASMVLAQSSLDDEINAELDRMYQTRNSAPSVQVNVQASPNQNQSAGQVTEAKSATVTTTDVETKVVQKQPTTVIEASPLTESRAERLRKARQDAEMKTEEKLVERIEHSRLEDERRRAEVLFGDRFNQLMKQSDQEVEQKAKQETEQKQVIVNENYGVQGDVTQGAQATSSQAMAQEQKAQPVMVDVPEAKPAPIYVPVPVIVQQPEVKKPEESELVIVDHDKDKKHDSHFDRDALKNELRAELDAEKREEQHDNRGYVAGMIGMGEYPDVKNVRGNYSLGFAIGSKMNDRMLIEASFQYSNYSIEQMDSGPWGFDPYYARITEMDQYTGAGAVKYQLLGGSFRPVVGGLLAYNYRTFSDVQLAFGDNDASSHAIDVGLMAGADIEVSRSFTIGADVRYMWNIFNRSSSDGFQRRFSQQVIGSGTPIEELNSLNFSLVGRATF